ncbi:MAG: hypothetical protein AAGG44_21665, partial [Planctomycetota bacterium]
MGELYLDTARLGQTTPSALKAQLDFARLTCEAPSSLYFEDYLQSGDSTAGRFAAHNQGIQGWHGIATLQQKLCEFAGCPETHRVMLG